MKKLIFLFLILWSSSTFAKDDLIFTVGQLNSVAYKIAIQEGSDYEAGIHQKFPNALKVYCPTYLECINYVRDGKADVLFEESHYLKAFSRTVKGLDVYPAVLRRTDAGMILNKNESELSEKLEEFLTFGRTTGLKKEMVNRWLESKNPKIPSLPKVKNPERKIYAGMERDYYPVAFLNENGKPEGLFVELLQRFAIYANLDIEFVPNTFDGMIQDLEAGKISVVASSITPFDGLKRFIFVGNRQQIASEYGFLIKKERIPKEKDFIEFRNARIGFEKGNPTFETKVAIPTSKIYEFPKENLVQALRMGKVDALFRSLPDAQQILQDNPDFVIYPTAITFMDFGLFMRRGLNFYLNQFNDAESQMFTNDDLQEIEKIWLGIDDTLKVMPPVPPETDQNFKVGYLPDNPPYSYVENGEVKGSMAYFLYKIFEYKHYGISELKPYSRKEIYDAIRNHEIDIAIGSLANTAEKHREFLFKKIGTGSVGVLVTTQKYLDSKNTFWDKIKKFLGY